MSKPEFLETLEMAEQKVNETTLFSLPFVLAEGWLCLGW